MAGSSSCEKKSRSGGGVGDGEHVVFADEHVLLAVELDLGAAVLAEQHRVADLDLERADLAVFEDFAVAHGDDLALDRLLLRRVGDDDAALGGALALEPLDDDAVLKWPDLHGFFSSLARWRARCRCPSPGALARLVSTRAPRWLKSRGR